MRASTNRSRSRSRGWPNNCPRASSRSQWLVELYGRTSDSFRLPDALANLGQAHEAAGNYDQALQAFEQLLDRDPENESARRQCERLRARLGLERSDVAAKPGSPAGEVCPGQPPRQTSRAAPARASQADEETQRFLAQALTDVDLFSSYGLTQKAMDLLETVLHRVPGHPSLSNGSSTCTSARATIAAPPNWPRSSSSFTESAATRPRPTASPSFAAVSSERPRSRPRRLPKPAPGRCRRKSSPFRSWTLNLCPSPWPQPRRPPKMSRRVLRCTKWIFPKNGPPWPARSKRRRLLPDRGGAGNRPRGGDHTAELAARESIERKRESGSGARAASPNICSNSTRVRAKRLHSKRQTRPRPKPMTS